MNLDLETGRLLLRPLQEDDVDLCLDLWTDPEVARYAGGVYPRDEIIAETPTFCTRAGGGCIGIWCVVDEASNRKIGSASLLPLPIDLDDTDWSLVKGSDMPPGEIEVGYIFKASAWGKGYATEVCGRLLEFTFTETPLEEIVAVTDPNHTASRHVLEKCGLTYEGQRRAYADYENSGYRITKSEWQARQLTA